MLSRICVGLCVLISLVVALPHPDSAGQPPLPGPGLSYGGIPYGSMSGNVAAYFGQASSSLHGKQLSSNAINVDFAPVAPYLR